MYILRWKDSGTGEAGKYDYSFFAKQQTITPGGQWWVTDYCHATIVVSNGDWVSFCNHQGWGCGQLLRSTNAGNSWTLTDSTDTIGIGNCVPFVDVSQNPNDLDDVVVTGGFGWMPDPAKHISNETFWAGGLRRSTNGGKSAYCSPLSLPSPSSIVLICSCWPRARCALSRATICALSWCVGHQLGYHAPIPVP